MSDYPYDLGVYVRTITTSSCDAQTWFDRGLNWIYGYNHEEAEVCFNKALEADPNCSMAYWGLAYIIGPNYNKPWELFDPVELQATLDTSRAALAQAEKNAAGATAIEQALIKALHKRYQSNEPVPDLYVWSHAYADEMMAVYKQFPQDADVVTLVVEAQMNLTPWKMWNPRTGEPNPVARTLETRNMLEKGINDVRVSGAGPHPGLWHLYIHLMEMSPEPEAALRVADEIRGLVPDAGHLEHMATHIDVLCGNYQDVVVSNSNGIKADEKYWALTGAMNFYSLYRVHNYHFKLYGAMFLGRFDLAMDAVKGLKTTIPEDLIEPMANWIEGYMSVETHVLVRFGKWDELIATSLPKDPALYCMTTALNYYGKGIAYAALGNHSAAADAQRKFEAAAAALDEGRMMHVVKCEAILGVAREMLAGEVNYHKGNHEIAFAHLRKAVELEDALPYDEPWGWMMPSRHALGALLLEQGHVEEAMAAYEADLGLDNTVLRSNRHPNNVWALLGLSKCYTLLGKEKEARMIQPQLDFALSRSDKIHASCFCSRDTAA
ncbi:MAG: tetratricopeptide repeat protein [Aliishimia sp.]